MESEAMIGKLLPFEVDSQKPIEIQCGGFNITMTLDQLSRGFDLSARCLSQRVSAYRRKFHLFFYPGVSRPNQSLEQTLLISNSKHASEQI
jgi:hypothetical protein